MNSRYKGGVSLPLKSRKWSDVATVVAIVAILTGCASPASQSGVELTAPRDVNAYETARNAILTFTQAQQREVFAPGDLVEISFVDVANFDRTQRVSAAGEISLPIIAEVVLAGMTIAEARKEITSRYKNILTNPQVTVAIIEYDRPVPQPQVVVSGQVRRPGAIVLDRPYRMVEAVAMAGGLTSSAAGDGIVRLRAEGDHFLASVVDLRGVMKSGDAGYVHPGDIIIVPETRISQMANVAAYIRTVLMLNGISLGASYRLDDRDY